MRLYSPGPPANDTQCRSPFQPRIDSQVINGEIPCIILIPKPEPSYDNIAFRARPCAKHMKTVLALLLICPKSNRGIYLLVNTVLAEEEIY